MERLVANWVYGGFLAGLLLLVMAPIFAAHWPPVLLAAYFHLPVYMLHQYEEHDRDRFRLFFNRTLGRGNDVLSPMAVFVTNVPGVWGVISLAIYLAYGLNPGWALIACYLMLVNAVVHIIHGLVFKCYNPGLATALVLFLPLSGYTIWLLADAGAGYHAAGLVSAILIHAAILVHVRRKLVML